jgi:hypothetical protein
MTFEVSLPSPSNRYVHLQGADEAEAADKAARLYFDEPSASPHRCRTPGCGVWETPKGKWFIVQWRGEPA